MLNSLPLVSILVPVYNVEKYIVDCANSIFGQDYEKIEFIFVDDCTLDNSIKLLENVIKKYTNRKDYVKIVKHAYNKGLAAARNTALLNSQGEFILHIDSDDFLSSNTTITELVNIALLEKSDAVFFDMQYYPNTMTFNNYIFPLNAYDLTKLTILREAPMSLCGCLYKRSLFMKYNIRSIESISLGEDYAIKPRLTYFMNKISHVSQPYYCYRQDNANSITTNFKESHIDDLGHCIQGFYDFFSDKREYAEIEPLIKVATVKCRVERLTVWSCSQGSLSGFNKILATFPSYLPAIKYLTPTEKGIYILSLLGLKRTLRVIANLKRKLNR